MNCLQHAYFQYWGGRNTNKAFEYFVNFISLMNIGNAKPPTSEIRKRWVKIE